MFTTKCNDRYPRLCLFHNGHDLAVSKFEPEHHSKAYLKSIQSSFNSQKNNKIGNLITDLRGTKFNSKTPNTLRIVYNYAVSPDITRSGYGLVAVEKEHGYAAYLHLTARDPSEAMLAACSIFKGYRIIPLSS